ncbi:MAG: hypothetical protein JW973_14570 [Bacteroidales bacterium]|nr:hypothetical protein [Bacteroidales bacterium]
MKRLISLVSFFLIILQTGAQITAVTEDGNAVILFSNGTWRYLNDSVRISYSNPIDLSTPVNSSNVLKGKEIDYAIWYDAKKWRILPDTVYSNAEYALEYNDGELIAMVITERIQISLPKIKETAIENFKKNHTEFKITEEQRIYVNDTEGLLLKIDALVDGIPFSYLNAYFSTHQGTFQLITYTGYNLFDRYYNDMLAFISGFTPGKK